MEPRELEMIEQFCAEDMELKSLWDQHREYEAMLQKYEGKHYLSPTQQQEMKELKKKKLAGKTKLQSILDKYRDPEG